MSFPSFLPPPPPPSGRQAATPGTTAPVSRFAQLEQRVESLTNLIEQQAAAVQAARGLTAENEALRQRQSNQEAETLRLRTELAELRTQAPAAPDAGLAAAVTAAQTTAQAASERATALLSAVEGQATALAVLQQTAGGIGQLGARLSALEQAPAPVAASDPHLAGLAAAVATVQATALAASERSAALLSAVEEQATALAGLQQTAGGVSQLGARLSALEQKPEPVAASDPHLAGTVAALGQQVSALTAQLVSQRETALGQVEALSAQLSGMQLAQEGNRGSIVDDALRLMNERIEALGRQFTADPTLTTALTRAGMILDPSALGGANNYSTTGKWTGGGLVASADPGGVVSTTTITGSNNTGTGRSTGVGQILFADGSNRDAVGFLKIYYGTTAGYVPIFSAN